MYQLSFVVHLRVVPRKVHVRLRGCGVPRLAAPTRRPRTQPAIIVTCNHNTAGNVFIDNHACTLLGPSTTQVGPTSIHGTNIQSYASQARIRYAQCGNSHALRESHICLSRSVVPWAWVHAQPRAPGCIVPAPQEPRTLPFKRMKLLRRGQACATAQGLRPFAAVWPRHPLRPRCR